MKKTKNNKPKSKLTDHVKNVCKIGQNENCCRYLMAGGGGFECGKTDKRAKIVIDQRVEHGMFTAKADNCDGQPDAILGNASYIDKN